MQSEHLKNKNSVPSINNLAKKIVDRINTKKKEISITEKQFIRSSLLVG